MFSRILSKLKSLLLYDSTVHSVLIILLIAIIAMLIFTPYAGNFKQNRKKFWKYLGLFSLAVMLLTIISFNPLLNNFGDRIFNMFVFYQIVLFIGGILHCYYYRSIFKKFEKDSVWIEIFFAVIVAIFLSMPLIIAHALMCNYAAEIDDSYSWYMALSLISFVVPTLFYATFEAAVSSPPKSYKTWRFLDDNEYPDPPEDSFRDMILLTLIFYKDAKSDVKTEFNIKAPIRMDFKRLFFHFVNDYNLRNPESPISITDENGERQHWLFYVVKTLGMLQFINPDHTVEANGLKENNVIVCQRTPPKYGSEEEAQKAMENREKNSEKASANVIKTGETNAPAESVPKKESDIF